MHHSLTLQEYWDQHVIKPFAAGGAGNPQLGIRILQVWSDRLQVDIAESGILANLQLSPEPVIAKNIQVPRSKERNSLTLINRDTAAFDWQIAFNFSKRLYPKQGIFLIILSLDIGARLFQQRHFDFAAVAGRYGQYKIFRIGIIVFGLANNGAVSRFV
ncbi:MAG: hypothetical protein B7X58_07615 [Marinobacter sp. 34-60-7]|nr:MAG: hypothetical protein B7X58_07615 [Marinobacter sp. 34-60-7]